VLSLRRMLPALHARLGQVHVVVSTYSLCLAIGVAAALVLATRRARRPDVVLVAGSLAVVAGVGGAGAWHRLAHGSHGLSSMGGIAAGLVAIVVVARALGARPLEALDALAPGAVLGFGIGRIGCLLAGCCYGRPAGVPWAIVASGAVARHPVQLYEAVVDVVIALAIARSPSGARAGRGAALAMIGYGAARVGVECWRDPASTDLLAIGLPTVAQLGGAALVLAGIALHHHARASPAS
jgi:phosphatidylglycerol:prolipoprotein diacylglycerol transferase